MGDKPRRVFYEKLFCGGKFLRSLTRSLGGQVGFGGEGDGMNDGLEGK